MEETKQLLTQLIDEVHGLDVAVLQVAKNQKTAAEIHEVDKKRNRRALMALTISVLCTVLVVVAGGMFMWRITIYAQCLSSWGAQLTARTSVVSDLAAVRQDTLDRLIRDVGRVPRDPALEATDYAAYIKASNDYDKGRADNPVPRSPQLACHIL